MRVHGVCMPAHAGVTMRILPSATFLSELFQVQLDGQGKGTTHCVLQLKQAIQQPASKERSQR